MDEVKYRLYHDKLIHHFLTNLTFFYNTLGFFPNGYETHKKVGPKNALKGELDIILYLNGFEKALIEAKSKIHSGPVQGTHLEKQMNFYSRYNPNADLFLLFGNEEESLDPRDFTLRRYDPISRVPSPQATFPFQSSCL